MNYKYQNFNFDEWFQDFVLMISEESSDLTTIQLIEGKEDFWWQRHNKNDDEINLCDQYLEYLLLFNKFMKLLSRETVDIKSLTTYIISVKCHNCSTSELETITNGVINGYNVKHNGSIFTRTIKERLVNFMEKYNIDHA